jgi:hypothetical protein
MFTYMHMYIFLCEVCLTAHKLQSCDYKLPCRLQFDVSLPACIVKVLITFNLVV